MEAPTAPMHVDAAGASSAAAAAAVAAAAAAGKDAPKEKRNVTPPKDFDLQSYMSNYTGNTRLHRLMAIAKASQELEAPAVQRALEEVKKTTNTGLYKELVDKYGEKLGVQLDRAWMDATDKRVALAIEKADAELGQHRTASNKDGTRHSLAELGDIYYDRGDFNSASKNYIRMRDYSSTPKQLLQMCLNVIKVSVDLGQLSQAANFVSKGEATPDLDPATAMRLRVVSGLNLLDGKKYKLASRKFIEITTELGSGPYDLVSLADVSIYATMCALATFDRMELKKKLLDHQPFKAVLDAAPLARSLANDFYASRYSSMLDTLQKLRPHLELDFYFAQHVGHIYDKIRSRALIQYVTPYVSVSLNTMSEAFKTTVPALEKELCALILENQIMARIDSHNKILYSRTTDQRAVTYAGAMKMGGEYATSTRLLLFRMNLLKHDFVVRGPREDDGHTLGKRGPS